MKNSHELCESLNIFLTEFIYICKLQRNDLKIYFVRDPKRGQKPRGVSAVVNVGVSRSLETFCTWKRHENDQKFNAGPHFSSRPRDECSWRKFPI